MVDVLLRPSKQCVGSAFAFHALSHTLLIIARYRHVVEVVTLSASHIQIDDLIERIPLCYELNKR